jgi:Na+/H+-translocating membrane pyrophosphatase
MGLDWSRGNYRSLCICAGALGGILLTRSEASRHVNYKWAAGMLGGGITSAIAFYTSLVWLGDVGDEGGPHTNIVLIMLCGVPGLIVYAIVKCCSDYTFPESYHSIPTTYNPPEGSSTSGSERKGSHPHTMQALR